MQTVRIGIIGDFNPDSPYHRATDDAIGHAADALSVAADITWLPTPLLDDPASESTLGQCDALWCSPGSPYESMSGALKAIRFARERDRPFLGT